MDRLGVMLDGWLIYHPSTSTFLLQRKLEPSTHGSAMQRHPNADIPIMKCENHPSIWLDQSPAFSEYLVEHFFIEWPAFRAFKAGITSLDRFL